LPIGSVPCIKVCFFQRRSSSRYSFCSWLDSIPYVKASSLGFTLIASAYCWLFGQAFATLALFALCPVLWFVGASVFLPGRDVGSSPLLVGAIKGETTKDSTCPEPKRRHFLITLLCGGGLLFCWFVRSGLVLCCLPGLPGISSFVPLG
jgi:hypothetical protein